MRHKLSFISATLSLVVAGIVTVSAVAAPDTIKVGILHSLSGTMAISETTLKDTILMMIDAQNKKGGVLGKKLEAVVVDPASNWPLFAEKAAQLLEKDKVAVVFGCWTSVSRKSVLPVFKELDGLLGGGAEAFKRAYDVTPAGNWEGRTILRRVTPAGTPDEEDELARARGILFQAREKRVRPGWDDKVLADWNGQAIAALVRAALVFERPEWLERARSTFGFIVTHMAAPHGGVAHAWRLGRITAPGLIEDQACMARAALALHEATGEADYLEHAERLADVAQAAFGDGHGGFFTTAADASDVPLTRLRSAADNATPSGNGVMAEVLARLFHLTGNPDWRARATAVLTAFGGQSDQLAGMPTLLAAADLLEEGTEVVIVGRPAESAALVQAGLAAPDPAVVVLLTADTAALAPGHPAFGKVAGPHAAVAYVCRRAVCGLPIADPAALSAALATRA